MDEDSYVLNQADSLFCLTEVMFVHYLLKEEDGRYIFKDYSISTWVDGVEDGRKFEKKVCNFK